MDKERKRSLKKLLLLSPISKAAPSEKVSFCAFFKKTGQASLGIETALILPVFFLGVVTMISFMDIYRIQTEHLTGLCQRAKEAGMYAYSAGETQDMILPDFYSYQPVGGLVPLPRIWMHNSVKVRAWTGKSTVSSGEEEMQGEAEKMVYVTENGEVYHRNLSCSYLNLSVEQISGASVYHRRNQYGEKYESCEICSRNQKPGGVVFITGKSNRYHNFGGCSGLKRTVRYMKECDVKGMGVCSRCG